MEHIPIFEYHGTLVAEQPGNQSEKDRRYKYQNCDYPNETSLIPATGKVIAARSNQAHGWGDPKVREVHAILDKVETTVRKGNLATPIATHCRPPMAVRQWERCPETGWTGPPHHNELSLGQQPDFLIFGFKFFLHEN